MKISMVLIAKDELDNVRPCFESFWDDVDEVVLVDTGSTDGTVEEAQAFAEEKGDDEKLVIGHFDWINDFSAARNYADSLATGDWLTWADLDDTVLGLPALRQEAEGAAISVNQLFADYDYAVGPSGSVYCVLKRERLVRKGTGKWVGRVHECQAVPGDIIMMQHDQARWVHRSSPADNTDRNELILREWHQAEPDDARVISYLAFELMGARKQTDNGTVPNQEKVAESVEFFKKYLALPGEHPEARAQSARRFSQVLMSLGDFDGAKTVTIPHLADCPAWSDSYLTLAEVAHEQQDWGKVLDFANQVIQRGMPNTMLIVNPEDYELRPRALIASAMASLGDLENAIKTAQQVTEKNPEYMSLSVQLEEWMGRLFRQQTGDTFANCAKILLEYDEPEKAAAVLNSLPFFCHDNATAIAGRIITKQRLEQPYQAGRLVKDTPAYNFILTQLTQQNNALETHEPTDS